MLFYNYFLNGELIITLVMYKTTFCTTANFGSFNLFSTYSTQFLNSKLLAKFYSKAYETMVKKNKDSVMYVRLESFVKNI